MSGRRTWWIRPKDDDARAFDTGYCNVKRPNPGSINPTDAELDRRGYFKVVPLSDLEAVERQLEDMNKNCISLSLHESRMKNVERDLEHERLRLAGCGVAAMQNTKKSSKDRIDRTNPNWSASYGDVCAAVDREMDLRERVAELENKVLRERYNCSMETQSAINSLIEKSSALEEKLKVAREALEYYVDIELTYGFKGTVSPGTPFQKTSESSNTSNIGFKAKEALAKLGERG